MNKEIINSQDKAIKPNFHYTTQVGIERLSYK